MVAIADGRIGNGLANAGDRLRLIDPDGVVVNGISWGGDQTFDAVTSPTAEESIHRASPNAAATIGVPSPGQPASPVEELPAPALSQVAQVAQVAQTEDASMLSHSDDPANPVEASPPALLITEVLPAPLTGQPEWVELHNPTDQTIDLDGWTIGDSEGQTALSGSIPPRSRLVVSTDALDDNIVGLVIGRIGNGLNNDGDTVSIVSPDGHTVHQVEYGTDSLPAPDRGLTIALIPSRWTVASTPTPGAADVSPLLEQALQSGSIKPPISDDERLPIAPSATEDGSDAWMIVSFALVGVILTLVSRRWRPVNAQPQPKPDTATATYSGRQGDSPGLERREDEEIPGQQ